MNDLMKRVQPLLQLINKNKQLVLGLVFLSVLGDIFYIPISSDFRFFGFLGVYAVSARKFKFKSNVTFLFCLMLLAIMYVLFLSTGTSVKTERAAVWLVLFWIVGTVQQWRELGNAPS